MKHLFTVLFVSFYVVVCPQRAQGQGLVGVTIAGGNGYGSAANQLKDPTDVAVDGAGNIYVMDTGNRRIQKWAPGATEGKTIAGGNGEGSAANQLGYSVSVAVDGAGNVYVADAGNNRIQKWAPGAIQGMTVAGGNGYGSVGNQLASPSGVAVDGAGNVYVADRGNQRIQKWAPGATEGVTVAGGNGYGSADNQLASPSGVAVDGDGTIYVANYGDGRIQKWAPGATKGVTVATEGAGPYDIAVDGDGNLYVAVPYARRQVLKWVPGATEWQIVASLYYPYGVAVDGAGTVYVAVYGDQLVKKFSPVVAPTLTSLSASPNPVCTGQDITFSATVGNVTGSYSFTLTNGAGSSVEGSAPTSTFSQQVTASGQGLQTYTLTVSSAGGKTSATVDVTVNPLPQGVSLSNNGPLSLNKNPITLTAGSSTAGVTYSFSPGAQPTGGNTATVSNSGVYSVTASLNGCRATASTSVLGAGSPTVCRNGTATLTLLAAGSPVRYEWYLNAPLGSVLRDGSFYGGATTARLSVINVQQSSIYYAKVYYADGSSVAYGPYKVNVNLNCSGRVGLSDEPGAGLQITLLGNPLEGDVLRAQVSGAEGERLQVELRDMGGRPVRQQIFEGAGSGQLLEWNLSGSAGGVYVLHAQSGLQRQGVKVVKP